MSVTLASQANRDLKATLDHLAENNRQAARTLRDEVFRVIDLLDSRAMEGAPTQMRSHRRAMRFYAHPFWILYERNGDVLHVLRLYHHARKPLT